LLKTTQKYDKPAGYFLTVTFAKIYCFMKKLVIPVLVLLVLFFGYSMLTKKPENTKAAKPKPIDVGEQSDGFNAAFVQMLEAYYRLKDGFVAGNAVAVDEANAELKKIADSLDINDIKGDSAGTIRETARYFSGTLATSAGTLGTKTDMEARRKEFNGITDALWNLTRTVKFSGEKIYYQYCPMAFNNQGAYWLSKDKTIRNPYFGSKMLSCGETQDSVDYSKQ
jgi:Protein of unknown function (DUF3347)